MAALLVSHGELVGLLLVAAGQLVVDAGHQVLVDGGLDRLLDDIHPPGRAQVHLNNKTPTKVKVKVKVFYCSS